jgi:tetrahydromethanopterin S-methyltransferase subunit G
MQGLKLERMPLPADTFSRVKAKQVSVILKVQNLISEIDQRILRVKAAQDALDKEANERITEAGQYSTITIAPLDDLTEVIRKKDNLVSMKQDLIADYEKFQSKHQIQMDDLAGNIQLKIDDFELLSQALQELEGLPNHYDNCQDFESLKEESEKIELKIEAIIAKYNNKLLSDSSNNLARAIVNKQNLLARQFQDRAMKVPASSPKPPQVPTSTPPPTPPQPNTRGSPTRHKVYGNTHLKQWSDDDFAALFVSLNKVSTGEAKPEDLVIAINYLEHELSDDEERALLSEKGQALQSPSGQNFVFTLANDVPKAILTAADSEKRASESQFQHQQRTAVTMMTMIDNVVAKGNVVEVDTEDPFLAKIAIDYLSYLKNEKGMSLAVTTVNGADIAEPIKIKGALPTDSDKTNDAFTNAALIFDKIKPSVEREIDKAAWFKAAKTIHQESLNDAANKGSNASTSQSPPTTHNKKS